MTTRSLAASTALIAGVVEGFAEHAPARVAVVRGTTAITYGQLHDDSMRLARWLMTLAVPDSADHRAWECTRARLAFFCRNAPAYFSTVVAADIAGWVTAGINYRYGPAELSGIVSRLRPLVVVYDDTTEATAQVAMADLGATVDTTWLHVDALSSAHLSTGLGASQAVQSIPAHYVGERRKLVLTGGTTGRPKAVVWRVADLVRGPLGLKADDLESASKRPRRAVRATKPVLAGAPFVHGAGEWFSLAALLRGDTCILPMSTGFNAEEWVRLIADCHVDRVLLSGDAMARPLASAARDLGRTLPRLRAVISAGGNLSPLAVTELEDALGSVRIVNLLGSSESGRVGASGSHSGTFRVESGVTLLRQDRSGFVSSVSDDVGILARTGPIPLGYLDDPEGTRLTFPVVDGTRYSVTGDLGRFVSQEGRIEFLGRESDVIVTGGEKVSAREVEGVLRQVPGVVDACVFGVPDDHWGSRLCAVVQVPDVSRIEVANIRQALRERLAGYKIPKIFRATEDPLTGEMGKIDRRKIAQSFLKQNPS